MQIVYPMLQQALMTLLTSVFGPVTRKVKSAFVAWKKRGRSGARAQQRLTWAAERRTLLRARRTRVMVVSGTQRMETPGPASATLQTARTSRHLWMRARRDGCRARPHRRQRQLPIVRMKRQMQTFMQLSSRHPLMGHRRGS